MARLLIRRVGGDFRNCPELCAGALHRGFRSRTDAVPAGSSQTQHRGKQSDFIHPRDRSAVFAAADLKPPDVFLCSFVSLQSQAVHPLMKIQQHCLQGRTLSGGPATYLAFPGTPRAPQVRQTQQTWS